MAETKKTSKKAEAAKNEKSAQSAEERITTMLEEAKKRGSLTSKELLDVF